MVLWMNVKEAREHLLKHDCVFSLRPKRRKRENCVEPLMYDGFGKKGEVWVGYCGEIPRWNNHWLLNFFVGQSGFKTSKEWLEKAKDSRYLYFIGLINHVD